MPDSLKRLRVALHFSFFFLLMLGVALKPMLGLLCETHAASHVLAEHHAGKAAHHDSASERSMDRAHAGGGHGLLHEGDQGTAYADLSVAIVVPASLRGPVQVGAKTFAAVPLKHLSGPFRPPIA